ncbi:MAG: alpha/beta hydrolase [Candidatus Eisenbacteria bacterium]|nr:alpha/beta hydrolase [Candidatus Eisenbacteria bacterium]
MPWRESPAELARARAEIPVVFDSPTGRLVGIYTPAAPDAPPAGTCAILLTRPRSHRNRMWVEGARRLAAQGFSAFRFDYHGDGDSQGVSGFHNPNQPDREDVVSALRFVRERFGDRRFLTLGMCFDARTALSVFADEPEAVRGMVFFAAPLMELDTLVKAHADQKDWKHMLRALTNRENWTSLGDPERWRYMGTVLGRVLRRGSRANGEAPNDTPLADTFVEHFRALVRSRARALFVYGDTDAEYVSFQVAQRTVFARLTPEERARFEVEVWPGDVHAFLNVPLQRRALERALEWFGSFHPDAKTHEGAKH